MIDNIETRVKNGKVIEVSVELQAICFKENDVFLAYIPALNICAHNTSVLKSLQSLKDGIKLYLEHWISVGELDSKLMATGWIKRQPVISPKTQKNMVAGTSFSPPENITIPFDLLKKESQTKKVKFDLDLAA